jgi:hypothetical protein
MTQWQPPQESRSDYPRHRLARDFCRDLPLLAGRGTLRDILGEEHAPSSRYTRSHQGVLAYDCGINRTYLSSVERS